MKYPIDLGKKMSPSPTMDSGIGLHDKSEMYYPTLHLEWDKPYNFPEEGTMVVKFRKGSETNSKSGDKVHQSLSLDVLKIVSVEGDAAEVGEPGERLDKLRKEVESLAQERDDY